jgi:hypothetical protein
LYQYQYQVSLAGFSVGAHVAIIFAVILTAVFTRRLHVGIEVKHATKWRREFGGPLKSLIEDRILQSGFGVYTGTVELKDGPLRVLPLRKFLMELAPPQSVALTAHCTI